MRQRVGDGAGRPPPTWGYALCYGLYLAVLALCYVSFWVWRATAEVVVGFVFRRTDALDAIYLGATLLMGLVLFALAVGSEPYLRSALERGTVPERRRGYGPLRRVAGRFTRLVFPLAGATLLALALQDWALHGAVAASPRPRPPAGAQATWTAPVDGVPPAASLQDRGAGAVLPWVAGGALAVAGTVLLAALRRSE